MQFHCLGLYQNDLYRNDFVSKWLVSLTLHTYNGRFSRIKWALTYSHVECVAWRFWLGALSNKGGRGQRNREEVGAGVREFRGFAARAPGSTKPPCYVGQQSWFPGSTCRLYLCIIFRGYLLFICRPKRGILSSLPAELEITGSVEVTDCFSRMFIASPRPNDQPLCHAVLVSLKLNVKMSSEGRQVYSSYFNLCEKLETTSSTMWTSCQKSSAEMVVPEDFVHRFKNCYNYIVATGQKMVSEK